MEDEHTYRVIAWCNAGKTGLAKSNSAPNAIHFAAPLQFGGLEGRWSPEDLLLCAIAGCFTTTFRALADYSKFEYTDLAVEVEGTVRKAESGYEFAGILIRPILTISNVEERRPRADQLLEKARCLCLVSRALSIPQTFESRVRAPARAEEVETFADDWELRLYGNSGCGTARASREHF
jgi:organic hydroperoxide reductase OsmC/OhrA